MREHEFLDQWFSSFRKMSAGILESSRISGDQYSVRFWVWVKSMASLRFKKEERKKKRKILCTLCVSSNFFPMEYECSGWIQSNVVAIITGLNGKFNIGLLRLRQGIVSTD